LTEAFSLEIDQRTEGFRWKRVGEKNPPQALVDLEPQLLSIELSFHA
jgi:hypothetical protein